MRRLALLAGGLVVATLVTVPAPLPSVAAIAPEPIASSRPAQSDPIGLPSPNDGIPWGLDRIDQRGPIDANPANRTYEYSNTGAGVTVYVVDSGVQASHSDLGGRVQDGWSYRADADALQSYIDSTIPVCGPTYQLEGISTYYRRAFDPAIFDGPNLNGNASIDATDVGTIDNDGHGTHVAGIVAGDDMGVAKGATIVPVRVLDSCGNGTLTMIVRGLQWVLARHQPGQKAVVNLSLGFDQQVAQVDSLIASLIAEGAVVVAAAGNSATTSCNTTPAGTPGTFSVGSMSSQLSNGVFIDRESSFSNFGNCVDIFAPGGRIASTWTYLREAVSGTVYPDAVVAMSGTSMAAPHVSGVLARYLETRSLTQSASTEVSVNAWQWVKTQATCNAVTPWDASRVTQTPNRMLAIGAPMEAPCPVTNANFTVNAGVATVTWTEPPAYNGEVPTYVATLQPGDHTCTTTSTTCTITGVSSDVTYQLEVNATNSAGTDGQTVRRVAPEIPAPTVSLSNVTATAGDRSLRVSWTGNVSDGATYTVTATPGGATCSTTATSCTVTGLVNNQLYVVTVVATNGAMSANSATTGTPNGAPLVPARIVTSTQIGRVRFSWTAVTDSVGVTYVLSTADGVHSCTTTATSCTIRNLPNGKARMLQLRTRTDAGGESASTASVKVWAGFKVRRTSVKRGTTPLLTSLVTPVSRGTVTWRSSSRCRIARGRLSTPNRATTCTLTVRTARRGSMPATSLRITITIR